MLPVVISGLTNLLLLLVLAPRYGVYGVLLSGTLSILLENLMIKTFAERSVGIKIGDVTNYLFLAGLVVIFGQIWVFVAMDPPWWTHTLFVVFWLALASLLFNFRKWVFR